MDEELENVTQGNHLEEQEQRSDVDEIWKCKRKTSSGMLKSSMSTIDERWHLFRGAEGFVRRGALRGND
jgi:hypothetical protein